jgi:hypothetical protein
MEAVLFTDDGEANNDIDTVRVWFFLFMHKSYILFHTNNFLILMFCHHFIW